jgi:hypothetical protein
MGLISEQSAFLEDACLLIGYARLNRFIVTGGELERTKEQQDIYVKEGKSKTNDSKHLVRCAIDLNFYKLVNSEYVIVLDRDALTHIGKYWENLNPKNRAGMFFNFVDTRHFERNV